MKPVANPPTIACKVCGSPSPLCGVVDFHKSCAEAQGLRLPLSGVPVYYRRCAACKFLFTDAFDTWSFEDFRDHIYNDHYLTFDPDYVEVRPASNAQLIANTFTNYRPSLRILDYGGGNGLLASRLRAAGFNAQSYDPFVPGDALPSTRFDLVTCFEVAEHAPFPDRWAAAIDSLLDKHGAILFSTLVQPSDIETLGLSWWYVGPRNGHVSLFTRMSLARLFAARGMRVLSFTDNLHFACREVPPFASHLNLPA